MADTGTGCTTTLSYTIHYIKTTWLLGCILSGIFYGILVHLSYHCFTTLQHRRRTRRNPRTNCGLMIYVVLTVLVGTVAEGMGINVTIKGVLDNSCQNDHLEPQNPYLGLIDIVFLIINLLTDGLFVWRCYVIVKGFHKRIWSLFWLVPLVVYIGMIVTGVILTTFFSLSQKRGGPGDTLLLVQFGISLVFNTSISSSIITLLLLHRRELARTFGPVNGKELEIPYLNILTVHIESASLILVVDVFAIVTIAFNMPLGNIGFQLWVHSQPIASLLIISRVSRGENYFSRKGKQEDDEESSIGELKFRPTEGVGETSDLN